MEFDKVVDTGDRQEFKTGSMRDTAAGKGTPHLIAGEIMSQIIPSHQHQLTRIEKLLFSYNTALEDGEGLNNIIDSAKIALLYLITLENGSYYNAMRRFSQHYENGAKKYAPNNWRKGQPMSRYYDSAMRHLWLLIDDNKDEDHASALLWNLTCIIQTKKDIERGYLPRELFDFPFTKAQLFSK